MIEIDLSKQQKLDPDPKVIQKINLTGNLEQQATIKKQNKLFWIFHKEL